jgi:signal transduction histidine kinase
LTTPAEDPRRAGFAAIFLVRAGMATAVAVGLAWAIAQDRRRLAAVARLTTELGEAPAPGTLATVLARSLQDPELQVGYWLAEEERHVDAAGQTVTLPPPGGRRAATRIVRGGDSVAVVVHDAALARGADLQSRIGAAARLAVDNERLQAAVLAQVEDLRASRARIVATGDAERRRLERDLHDGAQQRLLALSYELRLARAVATEVTALDDVLERAVASAGAALADLRDLAHGIYPAILADAGLADAVADIADTAPLPVELLAITTGRLAEAVETAAYVATAAAVDDAALRGASHAVVSIVRRDDVLLVEVKDDGRPRTAGLEDLADRVGALGGELATGPADMRVQLPCA